MTHIDEARLLKPDEAAEILQVSKYTMRNWRTHGGGPDYLRLGRQVRYRESTILAWAEQRGIDAKRS